MVQCTTTTTIVPIVTLVLITILNIIGAIVSFNVHLNIEQAEGHLGAVPDRLPLRLRPAALMVEATTYYGLEAEADWQSLMPLNHGFGFVRFGPQGQQPFEPSIYHQLHCLNELRRYFVYGLQNSSWHIGHCLNYLRQAVLCNADTTLEPSYPFILPDNTTTAGASGMDVMHTCVDWTQIRGFVEENQAQYSGVPLIF